MKCVCNSGVGSLFQKRDCKSALSRVSSLLIVSRKDNNRVLNSIDLATIPVPSSLFKGKFLNPDSSKRFHAIYDVKNVDYANRDNKKVEYNDGTSDLIAMGGLDFTFITPKSSLSFLANAQELTCSNPDIYLVLENGDIVGYANPDTIAVDKKLMPLPVETWEITKYSPTNTGDNVAHSEFTVHFSNQMDLGNWIVLGKDEHLFDILDNYEGIGVNIEVSTPASLTSISVKTTFASGHSIQGNSVPVQGLIDTDFELKVNGVSETILTATEAPIGTYALTYASQSSTDIVTVELSPANQFGLVAPMVTSVIP